MAVTYGRNQFYDSGPRRAVKHNPGNGGGPGPGARGQEMWKQANEAVYTTVYDTEIRQRYGRVKYVEHGEVLSSRISSPKGPTKFALLAYDL